MTIVAPAYNEEYTIVASIKSLLSLRYPEFEIVVVNDGSKDDTIGVMKEAFRTVLSGALYFPKANPNKTRARDLQSPDTSHAWFL